MPVKFLKFVWKELRVLTFGLSFAFFSSFGQTFFISLFVPLFRQEFALSKAYFGTMYSTATVCSAASLPYLGAWIDRTNLRTYGLAVATGLTLAALTVALSVHVILLFIGLYLLRLMGQGLSGHTARTSMARHYSSSRGKALSVVNLGFPIGEGVLPLVVTWTLSVLTWRMTWGIICGLVGLVFVPLVPLLIKNTKLSGKPPGDNRSANKNDSTVAETNGRYLELLAEPRFWFLAPAAVLPGFWITGLFLYQIDLADQLNWTEELIASSFIAFALGRITFSLLVGPAIDRWSARQLFPLYLIPLGAGFVTAFYHPGAWSVFLYMTLLGITMGAGGNLKTALWAELYGTNILGTVRSLFTSVSVFSTATSPFLMGWLLDWGVLMTTILGGAAISVAGATILAWIPLSNRFWSPNNSAR